MPIVRLSQNNLLRLIIQVPESAVSRIRVGAPVDVKVQALGRTFEGKVARFAEKLNLDTRTMETEVDVPNPKLELVPGMYAYASIATDEARGVLVVPVQAIDRKDDKIDGAGRRPRRHGSSRGRSASVSRRRIAWKCDPAWPPATWSSSAAARSSSRARSSRRSSCEPAAAEGAR